MGTQWWFRLAGALLAGLGGWGAGILIGNATDELGFIPWGLGGLLLGMALGLILIPLPGCSRPLRAASYSPSHERARW